MPVRLGAPFALAAAPIAPFMRPTRANRLLLADQAKKGVKCDAWSLPCD
jgi:hypothetical protein